MKASQRLLFEKLNKDDYAFSVSMSMDEAIMQYITGKALNLKEAQNRFEYQLKTNEANEKLGFFKAIEKSTFQIIGYLKIVKEDELTMEIGYATLPAFSGQGYASEMTEAMLIHTSTFFPEVKKTLGIVDYRNSASIHILEKYGFSPEKKEISESRIILHLTKYMSL
jgi:RimJ/RimL family protein N-acetyltransferase